MCQHLALFYAGAYPAKEISEFFAAGLAQGDCCLALLTAPHRRSVELGLRGRGVRIEQAAYVAVDSDTALAQCRVDNRLDMQRASELLTPLMTPPVGGGKGRIRAVGDLAPLLMEAGQTDDAVAFEGLVHRLAQEQGASVICAYPIAAVYGSGHVRALLRLSAEHSRVEFPQHLWTHDLAVPAPQSASSAQSG